TRVHPETNRVAAPSGGGSNAATCQHRFYQCIKPRTPHAPCEDVQNVEYNGCRPAADTRCYSLPIHHATRWLPVGGGWCHRAQFAAYHGGAHCNGYALSPLRTQGCGPSVLPLGYPGIHRFAVLVSEGPRD